MGDESAISPASLTMTEATNCLASATLPDPPSGRQHRTACSTMDRTAGTAKEESQKCWLTRSQGTPGSEAPSTDGSLAHRSAGEAEPRAASTSLERRNPESHQRTAAQRTA